MSDDSVFQSMGWWLLEHHGKFVIGTAAGIAAVGVRALLRWQRRRHDLQLHAIEQAVLGATERELELARQLLQTGRLNVEERRQLPGGKLRLSVLVAVARGELARRGRLPPAGAQGDAVPVALELRDDTYWIHHRHDNSARPAEDLKDAVETFVARLDRTMGAVPIDEDR